MELDRKITIFISSTFADLKEHRRAIIECIRRLGQDYSAMEEYVAESQIPAAKCVTEVAKSDLYVGVFAWRYGYIPEGSERSITHLEYDTAVQLNKPRLIFLLDEETPWKPAFIDDGQSGIRIRELRDILKVEQVVDFFSSPQELATKATAALAQEIIGIKVNRSSETGLAAREITSYQQWALIHNGQIDSLGLGKGNQTLALSDVFIPLELDPYPRHSGAERGEVGHQTDAASILRVLHESGEASGWLIIGDPGSGKTTLLKHLLVELLTKSGSQLGLPVEAVPLLVNLRAVGEFDCSDTLPMLIGSVLARASGGEFGREFVSKLWRRGNLLVLLDGLDEIANQGVRREIIKKIIGAAEAGYFNGIRILATCRRSSFDENWTRFTNLHCLLICPLSSQAARLFVVSWLKALARENYIATNPYFGRFNPEDDANDLIRHIDDEAYYSFKMRGVLASPFMLTLFCICATRGYGIPSSLSEFYHDALRVLLGRWSRDRGIPAALAVDDALALLRCLAYYLHERYRRDDLTLEEFQRLALTIPLPSLNSVRPEPETILRWLVGGAGVLTEFASGQYGISHLALQEYLAAAHIAESTDDQLSALAVHLHESWWREVVLNLVSLSGYNMFERLFSLAVNRDNISVLRELLQDSMRLAPKVTPKPFMHILEDAGASVEARAAVLRLFLHQNHPMLMRTAQQIANSPELSHDLTALARQISERKKIRPISGRRSPKRMLLEREVFVEPVYGIQFAPIPAGEYFMGTDELTGAAEERPAHAVRISSFAMAITTVTNSQYASFIKSTGHPEPAFWREDRLTHPEYPVVGVNWQDALRFCEHLSQVTGVPSTLPTEAQWEYGARGSDQRLYPWGNRVPDRTLACYYEGQLLTHPDPVGSYPAGRGPFGCLDQAGNVFEWCLDVWNPQVYVTRSRSKQPIIDPIVVEGLPSMRVLRGGAWWFTVEGLRATYRWRNPWTNRNDDIGFRPVINLQD